MTNTATMMAFAKDALFWESRGAQAMEKKEYAKAVTLYRQALRVSQNEPRIHLRYATALQGVGCYEESNAHIFEALALEPAKRLPFLIMGGNFLQLGDNARMMDTCAFLFQGSEDPEEKQLEVMLGVHHGRRTEDWRQMRYQRILHSTMEALLQKDTVSAERLLQKANTVTLLSLRVAVQLCQIWLLGLQKEKVDVTTACKAMRNYLQYDLTMILLAAYAFHAHHNRSKVGSLLLRACALSALKDEQLITKVAMDCGFPNIAMALAYRNVKTAPNRVPSCYNLAKCLLMAKRRKEAKVYVNRCLNIAGDDPYVRLLSSRQTKKQAMTLPTYGDKRQKDFDVLLAPLIDCLSQGYDALALAFCEQPMLRKQLFLSLHFPQNPITKCLPDVIERMPTDDAVSLLRQLLSASPSRSDLTVYAGQKLCELHQKPPFCVCFDQKLLYYDPTAPLIERKPLLRQRMLHRYFARIARKHGSEATTFAFYLLRKLSKKDQNKAFLNKDGMWQTAFDQVYENKRTLPDWYRPTVLYNQARRTEYARMYQTILYLRFEYRREYP